MMKTSMLKTLAAAVALAAIAMSPAVQGSKPMRKSLPVTTIAKHTTDPTARSMPRESAQATAPNSNQKAPKTVTRIAENQRRSKVSMRKSRGSCGM